jgi:hypothetical protein
MKRKFTVIVIENKRRLCSFEISTFFLITSLSLAVGFFLIPIIFFITAPQLQENAKTQIDSGDSLKAYVDDASKKAERAIKPQEAGNETVSISARHPLTIEDFTAIFDSENKFLRYKFLLRNHSEESVISGHIFIVVKPRASVALPWLAFPKTALRDGSPVNFTEGDSFAISKYKVISNHVPIQNVYDSVLVYIFSNNGTLILKESFNIKTS